MRCKRLLINYAAGLELALCGDDSHGPSRGAVPWIGIGKPLDIRHRRHGIVPQRGLRRIPEVRLNPVGETPSQTGTTPAASTANTKPRFIARRLS